MRLQSKNVGYVVVTSLYFNAQALEFIVVARCIRSSLVDVHIITYLYYTNLCQTKLMPSDLTCSTCMDTTNDPC